MAASQQDIREIKYLLKTTRPPKKIFELEFNLKTTLRFTVLFRCSNHCKLLLRLSLTEYSEIFPHILEAT